jgi:flagellar basal body rod protein FlgG
MVATARWSVSTPDNLQKIGKPIFNADEVGQFTALEATEIQVNQGFIEMSNIMRFGP